MTSFREGIFLMSSLKARIPCFLREMLFQMLGNEEINSYLEIFRFKDWHATSSFNPIPRDSNPLSVMRPLESK